MKPSVLVPLLAAVLSTQTITAMAIDNGRYAIISRHSGLALDVDANSTADGANVVQWEYTGGENQQFDITNLGNGYYTIRPAHSGKSLDVWEWSTEPGGEIRQWQFTGGYNQQWAIDNAGNGYHTISSRHSGLPLDVWTWSTALPEAIPVSGSQDRNQSVMSVSSQSPMAGTTDLSTTIPRCEAPSITRTSPSVYRFTTGLNFSG